MSVSVNTEALVEAVEKEAVVPVNAPESVKPVSVPTEVIFVCAAPVTVAAVPDTLPVTLPVSGPAKASDVTVPSK